MKVALLALLTLFAFAACDEDCDIAPAPSICDDTLQIVQCDGRDFQVVDCCQHKCSPRDPFICYDSAVFLCPCDGSPCSLKVGSVHP